MLQRGNTLHRKLIFRLSVMALAVSVSAAIGAALSEQKNMRELAAERAIQASSHFTTMIAEHLDSPDLGDHAKIQEALEKFSSERVRLSKGSFVLARILDKDFLEVARVSDPGYAQIAAVTTYAESHADRGAVGDGVSAKATRIDRLPIIRVVFPLAGDAGTPAAYGDAFFAISPEALKEERWRVARAAGSVVAIVS